MAAVWYCHVLSDYRRGLDWLGFIGSQWTLYNLLQYTSLSSLGRVFTRQGPGPPADPTHFAGSSPKTATAGTALMASLAITTTQPKTDKQASQSNFTTDDQSVSPSWCRAPSGARDQVLITVWHLLFCRCRAPPSDERSGLSSVLVTWTASVQ
jgi:hypothetical protein